MTLYTKAGDEGFTHLSAPGGKTLRLRKDDPRIAALGDIDELNADLGLCLAEAGRISHVFIRHTLGPVQGELLAIGAILATGAAGGRQKIQLSPSAVARMERDIDAVCADLPELKHFILTGGSDLAARLHVARAVCRRTERAVVDILNPAGRAATRKAAGHKTAPPRDSAAQAALVLQYLNRLSDLLFALARLANSDSGEPDVPWTP